MSSILSTENKVFFSQLKKLMLPIAFQSLVHSAVSAGDAAMLGFISQDAMAAVSLTAQIQFVQNMFLSTFVSGATLMTAQYWGKGDKSTVGRIFSLILRYAFFVSAVFFLAALFVPEKMIGFYTVEPELIRIGSEYIRIASLSYLLTGISQCFLCVMKTTGNTKQSVAISSFSLGLDTVLNAVFIFGLFGCPAMGARGAALTTVISRVIELALALFFTVRSGVLPKGLLRIVPILEKDFWRYSFPLLLNCLTWGMGTTSYSAIIGHMGGNATAANSVAALVRSLAVFLCQGLGRGGEILLAGLMGAGELDKARRYGRKLSILSVVFGCVASCLVLLIGPVISSFMTLSAEARELLQFMLMITAGYVITYSINTVVICGVFSSGGDTYFDAYSVAVTMWLFILPMAAMAAFWWHLPVLAVYGILSLDEVIKIPWVYAHYKKYKWLRNITRDNLE